MTDSVVIKATKGARLNAIKKGKPLSLSKLKRMYLILVRLRIAQIIVQANSAAAQSLAEYGPILGLFGAATFIKLGERETEKIRRRYIHFAPRAKKSPGYNSKVRVLC